MSEEDDIDLSGKDIVKSSISLFPVYSFERKHLFTGINSLFLVTTFNSFYCCFDTIKDESIEYKENYILSKLEA